MPWRVDREQAPRYGLVNVGREAAIGVMLYPLGSSTLVVGAPTTLGPGGRLDFSVLGDDVARAMVIVVRWFRPSGEEYLWRISF